MFAGKFHLKPHHAVAALLLCGWGSAHAEIYKSVDADGHVTYSSTPSKGSKKLGLEPLAPPSRASRSSRSSSSSHSSSSRSKVSPRDFPRVDTRTQKRRDDMRHRILSDELKTEKKLLAEAQASLKKGEASGAALPEGKLRTLREDVAAHERNIDALQTELANLK